MNNLCYIRWGNVFKFIIFPILLIIFIWMLYILIKDLIDYTNRTETFHISATIKVVKYDEIFEERHNKRRHTYYPVLIETPNGKIESYIYDTYRNDHIYPKVGDEVYKDCWTEVNGNKFCDSEWKENFTYPSTTPMAQKVVDSILHADIQSLSPNLSKVSNNEQSNQNSSGQSY